MSFTLGDSILGKTIGIAIGIAVEIENSQKPNIFDPDPDFDPENTFESIHNEQLTWALWITVLTKYVPVAGREVF